MSSAIELLSCLLHLNSNVEDILSNDELFAYLTCQMLCLHRLYTYNGSIPVKNSVECCIILLQAMCKSIPDRNMVQIHPKLRNILEIYK